MNPKPFSSLNHFTVPVIPFAFPEPREPDLDSTMMASTLTMSTFRLRLLDGATTTSSTASCGG